MRRDTKGSEGIRGDLKASEGIARIRRNPKEPYLVEARVGKEVVVVVRAPWFRLGAPVAIVREQDGVAQLARGEAGALVMEHHPDVVLAAGGVPERVVALDVLQRRFRDQGSDGYRREQKGARRDQKGAEGLRRTRRSRTCSADFMSSAPWCDLRRFSCWARP